MKDLRSDLGRLLKDMTLIPALSGHEERMAAYLTEALAGLVSDVGTDRLGNVIARIEGKDPKAPRVMVFAHMDQLGFVVRKIDDDGLVRLERLGGVPEKVLPGLRVVLETEEHKLVPGLIGIKSHHATPADEKYVVTPYTELYVDVGAASRQEVRGWGIDTGCPVLYEPRFLTLESGRVSATSVDNRGGCAVLVELAQHFAKSPPICSLFLVGTVQEEFNLRGAVAAASRIQPDLAVALDIVISCDTPDLTERSSLKLGGGPVMGMYSFHGRGTLNGTLPHPALVRLFRKVAEARGMALQKSANLGSLTDSAYVQLTGTGVPCIDLGFPVRYTHTPVEVCDLADVEALYRLLAAGIEAVDADFDFSRV